MLTRGKISILSLLLILGLAGTALAHRVNLFAYAEGGTVYTESYFPDGRPVTGGTVKVYDDAEVLLLDGMTDEQGFFNFPIPKLTELQIVIEATMGHKNSFTLKKEELEAGQ